MTNLPMMDIKDWTRDWNEDKLRSVLMVVLSLVAAIFIGLMVDAVMRRFGDFMYPPPPSLQLSKGEELKALLSAMPVEAYLIKILSWLIGSLVGAYIAVRMSKIGEFPAWIAGFLILSCYYLGMLGTPHPMWVWIACFVVVTGASFGAGRLANLVNLAQKDESEEA